MNFVSQSQTISLNKTDRFFDSYAEEFYAIYGNSNNLLNKIVNNLFRKSMTIRFNKTLEGCSPISGRTVIDVGCGPGHYGVLLAKQGADKILGVDFAPGMIELAQKNAVEHNINQKCQFIQNDVIKYKPTEKYNFAILMGLMDYIEKPKELIENVLSYTTEKAFFSFPIAGGFLAWQRKLRYQRKCVLYMYTREDVENLFHGLECQNIDIENIGRDFFVTVTI